jgi:hypothetical protein
MTQQLQPTAADREAACDFAAWHEGFKTPEEVYQLSRAFAMHAAQARADALAVNDATVERLRAALAAIVEGDVPRPVGKVYRGDGMPSKHDQCTHGVWMYDDCGNCVSDFALAALRSDG